MNYVLIAKIEL